MEGDGRGHENDKGNVGVREDLFKMKEKIKKRIKEQRKMPRKE